VTVRYLSILRTVANALTLPGIRTSKSCSTPRRKATWSALAAQAANAETTGSEESGDGIAGIMSSVIEKKVRHWSGVNAGDWKGGVASGGIETFITAGLFSFFSFETMQLQNPSRLRGLADERERSSPIYVQLLSSA